MKRRILAWLVVLCLTLTLLPMGLAESNETTDTQECCEHACCEHACCENENCDHEHCELAQCEDCNTQEQEQSDTSVRGEDDCMHENAYLDDIEYGDYSYTDTGDNLWHLSSRLVKETWYCPDCGWTATYEDTMTEEDNHRYNENGVCENCGHVNNCPHENAYENSYYSISTYTDNGSNRTHTCTGVYVEYQYCPDCGMKYDVRETPFTDEWSHNYNENGICGDCGHENTCTHENTDEGWYWKDWWAVTYTDTGDNRTHAVSGIRIVYTYCNDCGIQLSDAVEEQYTDTGYDHDYDENGVCTDCGHVNTCTHENTAEDWRWKGARTYTDTGDNRTHEVSGIRLVFTYCEDCGMTLSDRVEEPYTGTQRHSYNENSVCTQCGHVNTCTHEHAYQDWYWKDWGARTFTDTGDNGTHTVSGIRIVYTSCEDCGMKLSDNVEEWYTDTEWHNYQDGVCVQCGHVNSCPHHNLHEARYLEDAEYFDDKDDNMYCLVTASRYYSFYECWDCGETFDEVLHDEPITEHWMHDYDENGVCNRCGHVNTCTHENAFFDWYWSDSVDLVYTDNGDDTHMVTGIRVCYSYCRDCGQDFDWQEEEYTNTERHQYNQDGVCDACGHVNLCPHNHTYQSWYWKDWEAVVYEDTGSNATHVESGVRVIFTYCDNCGMTLSIDGEEFYSREMAHDYNQDGECWSCGHVNTCTHQNTYDWWEPYNWSISTCEDIGSNLIHRLIGTRRVQTVCADCGITMSMRTETYTTYDTHSYNENGVCIDCGHKNMCEHLHTYTYITSVWDTLTFTDHGSDTTHTASGKGYRITYCQDCEKVLAREEVDFYEEEWTHDYNQDGVCETCGHHNHCTHENTYTVSYAEYGTDFFTDTGDNKTHTVRGRFVTGEYCKDCYQLLSSHTEVVTKTEAHYYRDGYCVDCGHKNTCTHEHISQGGYFTGNYEFSFDALYHMYHGTFVAREYCEDCGIGWDIGTYEDYTYFELHEFEKESDVCKWCGETITTTGWVKHADQWYYLAEKHVIATDWQKIDNVWYYFNEDGIMQTGWQKINNAWYYFTSGGKMVTGWQKIGSSWYYFQSGGKMVTGWQKISNKWYYFTSGGQMVTGWQKISNKWYYFESGGQMATGWKQLSGKWYYFESSGAMATGWKQLGGKWYYFESGGQMATGWKLLSNKWYYFESSGAMKTGWLKLNNKWYWFESSGAMFSNGSKTINGKTYNFDANGVCLNP